MLSTKQNSTKCILEKTGPKHGCLSYDIFISWVFLKNASRWQVKINLWLKTDAKKIRLAQKLAVSKNNQADIQATLPTHDLIILSKFHKYWKEIVDFIVIAKLWGSLIFLYKSL